MNSSSDSLDKFSELWGPRADRYVIFRTQPDATGFDHCIVLDTSIDGAVIIEDDETAIEVMKRMVQAGVKIVTTLPHREPGEAPGEA